MCSDISCPNSKFDNITEHIGHDNFNKNVSDKFSIRNFPVFIFTLFVVLSCEICEKCANRKVWNVSFIKELDGKLFLHASTYYTYIYTYYTHRHVFPISDSKYYIIQLVSLHVVLIMYHVNFIQMYRLNLRWKIQHRAEMENSTSKSQI